MRQHADNLQESTDIILHGREERNIEYKPSILWNDRKDKKWIEIAKTILGMANLRDGGFIVIGIEQRNNDFVLSGISSDHLVSFNQDSVDDVMRNYADPFVKAYVTNLKYEDKVFVIIQVSEFEEIPVICKDNYTLGGKVFLRKGAIYTRSRGKSETAEVHTQTEMREIIELAVDKSRQYFTERMKIILGEILENVKMKPSNEEEYDKQVPDNSRM